MKPKTMTPPDKDEPKKLVELVLDMISAVNKSGVKPDTLFIKGTTLQSLRKELEQPQEQIFGMNIEVKPDDVMPDGVELMVVNRMSVYPPLEQSLKEQSKGVE